MAIIKAGFTKGFRGRNKAASFGRRAHYLAAEHDRAGVTILDRDGEGLSAKAAIERMGGSEAEYHEIIVSPSHLECEAIRQYGSLADSEKAITDTARRVSESYADGREYVTAVHWSDDGRFHFHVTVQGVETPGTLGERGQFQKVWNAQWIHQPKEHRVRDWDLHGKSKELQSQASSLARDQRSMAKERTEEIKTAPSELKGEIMDRWRVKESRVAAQRLEVETQAIEARYGCRGLSDSILKEVEIEKAQIRYQRALNDLDRAEERIRTNHLVQAYNKDSQGIAREYGKMFRAAGEEEREEIRNEHRAAQVVLVERLTHSDTEKINARHQAAGSLGSIAHKADLERAEENRAFRLQQADARFEHEELRGSLSEARKERDSSIRKASNPEEIGAIQNDYESRRLDLWEASSAAKVRVTDLEFRIRGNADSEAHIRAIARVSEQEGKSLDKAIETDRMKDEMLNIRMDIHVIGEQKREAYRLEDPSKREAELSRLNESETILSQKVMAYELTMLQREYQGKADRVQWQKDRESILSKAREDLQKSTQPDEQRHQDNEKHEEAVDNDHEARLVLEHKEEEAREEALHRAHEEDAKQAEERDQAEDMARLAALSFAVEMYREEPESQELNRDSGLQEPKAELNTYPEPPEAWPEELRADYLARVERIQARFQGVQDRQELEPGIREKRESLEQLQDKVREELCAPGADRATIIKAYKEQADPIREELRNLQRERLDTYFRPRAEGSGIGSDEHQKAVLELDSRSTLQAVREDLNIERSSLHGQRSEDLKALGRQAERECLSSEETSQLKDEIHARTETQERALAIRLREEERRHNETTQEGESKEQQEKMADERMAATMERITLDREIRAVRESLRELRGERSEALSPEGTDRAAVSQDFAARLQPVRAELESLEASRLDTYHKGQPEERAIGSEAHQAAREGLEAQQKAAREREGLQLQQEVNRLDRHDHTQGLDAPADRERREEIHATHDAREVAIAARLKEMDRRGIDYTHDEGTPEHKKAVEDLETRYSAIAERQTLDRSIRADQDAIRDLRAATLDRLQEPGTDRAAVMEDHRHQTETLRVEMNRHQAERLGTYHKGQPEDRALGSEEHQEARRNLEARQQLQAVREDVGLERQVLNMERREALDRAAVHARQELMPEHEARQQREEIHAAHGARELALADRTLEAEKAHANRTLEEGTRQHERATREAEERREAAVERLAIETELRLVKDQIQDIKAERSEALSHEGADRAAIIQDYEARLKPSRTEQERLEAARTDTYHKGQPEARATGSEAHQAARQELEARQGLARERESLSLEREVIRNDRQDAVRHVEDRDVREAVHQRYDAKELDLVHRQADLDRRQADLVHTPGSEDHTKALAQTDSKVQALGERQVIDRQLRQVDDRSQDLREKIRTDLEQPGVDRQKVLEEHRSALQEVRQEAEKLHMERLDNRFRAEGQENTPEHQEAREKLAERLDNRAAREDHGLQKAAMSAEKREALEGLRASQDLAEERREILRKVPKIGAVLDLAAKPSTEKQITSREAVHEIHNVKEQAHAAKGLEVEKAHLDRTLQPGTKEHTRAVDLAESKVRAVEERQVIDKELRSIRDQISQIRTDARNAERRPFADKAEIRTEAQMKVDQLRGRAEELEHRRLSLQTATREPIRMDSPEGRAHQKETEASRIHLAKDHELRKEIDELRQSIAHARTDYQAQYKRDFLNRPAIQQEYKTQELQKVDRIHTLEVARIDASHAAAGTTGGKEHQADLSSETARHAEARIATDERDLGRKLSALEAYAHIKTVANLAVNGAAPDRIAKQVESRVVNAATNAALDAAMGEYAVVAKVAKQVLTMGR